MKNATDALNDAIITLENKSAREFKVLKHQFNTTIEMFKPINLIKSTLREVTSSPGITDNVASSLTGMGAGFFTKKLFVGNSRNPLTRMFGTLIQFATASVVSKHAVDIRDFGGNLISRFLQNRKEKKELEKKNEMPLRT